MGASSSAGQEASYGLGSCGSYCLALSSHNIWSWIDASINDKQIKVEELKSNLSIGLKYEDML